MLSLPSDRLKNASGNALASIIATTGHEKCIAINRRHRRHGWKKKRVRSVWWMDFRVNVLLWISFLKMTKNFLGVFSFNFSESIWIDPPPPSSSSSLPSRVSKGKGYRVRRVLVFVAVLCWFGIPNAFRSCVVTGGDSFNISATLFQEI